jgi:hypothetical protein
LILADPVLTNSLRIKNKGGFTATIVFTYRYNNKNYEEKQHITSGKS